MLNLNILKRYLMVSSRVVDYKVLKMAIYFENFFSDKKEKWGM